ncbi:CRISPR-associated protein Cas1 [Methanococcus aeolicus Nankai-3]|uniref:CRISPR-associated endonuclease Cas1 n=1 Tax=Methanococcus aeolicus (strain ATCC BAA-1280 / DSM 17508 / OCM 812 / Nankai-3) TaxID=419665 RepID=A6UVX9_META3|nr:CRISPR-associated endonuclease Cas1 [Methanococcus aeolicus]ABR56651.1 CRISPR-associated protein Cas1 [Methanococcus aeolicus Nankai-3]
MDLLLKTNGFFISKKEDRFRVELEKDGKIIKTDIPATKIERIILSNNGTITTGAISLAIENNIPIIFLKWEEPTGMIWHCRIGKTAKTRRSQLKFSESINGIRFASNWIKQKMGNQLNYLKDLKKNHNHKGDFDTVIKNINNYIMELTQYTNNIDDKLPHREIKDTIIGIEGIASKYYFEGINHALPKNYKFKERSRRPARDKFNALLNYGYGMLYPMVEKCLIVAGLDPYVGFIHADNYNKTTLVYDVIEMYRAHIDRGVVNFINSKKVKGSHFNILENGISLSDDGKGEFAPYIKDIVFGKEFYFKNKKYLLPDFIQKECYEIAKSIRGKIL